MQQSMFETAELYDYHRERKYVKARQVGGTGFKPVPEGVHAGVITGLVDLGKQPGTGLIKDAYKLAVIVSFPGLLTEEGQPMSITKTYTSSMFKLANLRKDIESLFAKAFPSQEAADAFDFTTLLGRAGLFSVSHKQSGEKTFANISGVMALPAGMPKPEVSPASFVVFDLGLKGDEYVQAYAKVPQWLQKKIENRLPDEGDAGGGDEATEDDDIPF